MTQPELDQIIAHGEDYKIKFKNGLNTYLKKELVAFANESDVGLSEPQFSFDDFFRVTFIREYEAVSDAVNDAVKKFGVKFGEKFGISVKRSKRLAQIFYTIYHQERFAVEGFAKKQEISVRQIEKDLQFLTEKGLITFKGAPKTGEYICTKAGNTFMESLMNNTE